MKKKKTLILLILVMLIIILLLCILKVLKNKNEEEEHIILENPRLTTTLDIYKLENEKEFFTVEKCINKYFETLKESNTNGVYSLLNNKYIEQNNINASNVLQKVYKFKGGFEEFIVKNIYYREVSYDTEYQYYIYGEILGENYSSSTPIYIIANLDYMNNSFNISFDGQIEVDKEEYLNIIENLKNGNTNKFIYVEDQKVTNIELNDYNEFEEYVSNDPYALDRYLENYSIMAIYYPDIAYNLLDEEYRNRRFGSIESYKQYVLSNKSKLLNNTIKEYNISEKEGYTQYVVVDTNGNYYIFKVTDIMEYTLLTDFYTIDVEEIVNNYDNSNVQGRVAINIQKVIAALNAKDYNYVYSKLADGFKANKYPTLESFKNYISGVVTGNRQIKFSDFHNEGETYIYSISLVGITASSGDPVNMQIIMQLKDNRNFVMSFNIGE